MQYNIALPVPGGLPDNQVEVLASSDGSLGTTVDQVKVLQGRMFGPGTVGEAVIDPGTAAREHLAPGDTLHLVATPYLDANGDIDPAKSQVPLTFRVAAVGVFDDQVVPATGNQQRATVLLQPRVHPHPPWPPALMVPGARSTTWRRRTCGCGRARTRPRSSLGAGAGPAGIRAVRRTAASSSPTAPPR